MIDLRNLAKHYGNIVAVRNLSLQVAEGESLVLLGGSGSGKTTTLKMINRLIEPTAGSVWVDGTNVAGLPPTSYDDASVIPFNR
jgi:osmoprotectant transport system ATP-binding protein